MPRDMTFTSSPANDAPTNWSDGVPMSNAERARKRMEQMSAMLGDMHSSGRPTHWKQQPVGGRYGADAGKAVHGHAPANPFESRLFSSRAPAAPTGGGGHRMHNQHGDGMAAMSEFAGAAGVSSSRVAGANLNQGPRTVARSAFDPFGAAGSKTATVGKDQAIFHSGPHARRTHSSEGTTKTAVLTGAAAAAVRA